MNVSERLKTIAGIIGYDSVCDIGADHGYLLIYRAKTRFLARGAACDVKNGPLSRAAENISREKLSGVIQTRLGYGLAPVAPGEFDCCVISGMGGKLIIEILENDNEKAHSFKQLIVSPHRDCESVRRFLHAGGFVIKDEIMITDEGKSYNIIDCRPGTEAAYDDKGYVFGKKLIEKRDPALAAHIEKEMARAGGILRSGGPESVRRYYDLCSEAYKCLLK